MFCHRSQSDLGTVSMTVMWLTDSGKAPEVSVSVLHSFT
jgi:hypothetical protein